MTQYYCFIFLIFSALSQCKSSDQAPSIFTKSNELFGARIYAAVNENNKNILLSPVSLNYILTAFSFGTQGNTLRELRNALDQPDDEKEIGSSYRLFTESLNGNDDLKIATKAYFDNNFQVKEQFKKSVSHDFEAGFDNVNFAGDVEGSRQIINKFVDNKTNHLIPELLNKGAVTPLTNAVIVNALYFKSQWAKPFVKENTEKKTFYSFNDEYKVDMMQEYSRNFNYTESKTLNAKIIEIPYKNLRYSFVVILPNERLGIADVEKALNLAGQSQNIKSFPLNDILNELTSATVDLSLPKFRSDQYYDLKPKLIKMGLSHLFQSGTDFQRISDQQFIVDQVLQKTHITVDENGTEAAAATAITGFGSGLVTQLKQFNADHPFIYIIRDTETETPLFIGRYVTPDL